MVNHVVPLDDLMIKARMILDMIITRAPLAISRCISAANAAIGTERGYEMEIESFGDCFDTDDMKEGAAAFLEKRKPRFVGR